MGVETRGHTPGVGVGLVKSVHQAQETTVNVPVWVWPLWWLESLTPGMARVRYSLCQVGEKMEDIPVWI